MKFENINPTGTVAWSNLRDYFEKICYVPMQEMFANDSQRASKFSVQFEGLLFDFSKNKIDDRVLNLFIELSNEMNLKGAINSLFLGEKINVTESRSVLHTALRAPHNKQIFIDGVNIISEVVTAKNKIKDFSERVISGEFKGYTGKSITDVVNIGIGGSDLGPAMVTEALKFYKNHLKLHYVSNIDGDGLAEVLKEINPETTLFVVVSKTFTTQETLTNAKTIKKWFLQFAKQHDVSKHFIAVSSNLDKVVEFGISDENIFPMWDWVGGRYSLWSSVGISIALGVGYDNFEKLLNGANKLDEHFQTSEFKKNIPVILAYLSIWYNNFFEAQTHCVIPYSDYLKKFIPFLQQLVMESNGKNISRSGDPVNTQTGNIIFGEIGSNAQHAFFQLLHQGTKLIPTDFIGFKKSLHGNKEHHDILMANFFAQTEAFLMGREFNSDLGDNAAYKEFYGDKPTNTLLFDQLTPENLGILIAIYEHKTFVEGFLWNIYSFDQFGVELGKELASSIKQVIDGEREINHDCSTSNLLIKYKE